MRLLIIFTLFFSSAAIAKARKYTPESNVILGAYDLVSSDNMDYEYAEVKFDEEGVLTVFFGYDEESLEASAPILPNSRGLRFEADVDDECDDPGCGTVTYVEGVLVPEKVGSKSVPTLNVKVTVEYYYPEYEGDREGAYVFKMKLRWHKKIVDSEPLWKNSPVDSRVQALLDDCSQNQAALQNSIDCLKASQFNFEVPVEGAALDKWLSQQGWGKNLVSISRRDFIDLMRSRYDWQLNYAEHVALTKKNKEAFKAMQSLPKRLRGMFSTRRYDEFFLLRQYNISSRYSYELRFVAIDRDSNKLVVFRFHQN